MNSHPHSSNTLTERIRKNAKNIYTYLVIAEERHEPGTDVLIGDKQLKKELEQTYDVDWRHVQCSFSPIHDEVANMYVNQDDIVSSRKWYYKFYVNNGKHEERLACLKALLIEMGKYFSNLGYNLNMTVTPWTEGKNNKDLD